MNAKDFNEKNAEGGYIQYSFDTVPFKYSSSITVNNPEEAVKDALEVTNKCNEKLNHVFAEWLVNGKWYYRILWDAGIPGDSFKENTIEIGDGIRTFPEVCALCGGK
jgi:hypothetical protein